MQPGDEVGPYRLTERIATGLQGVVFKASAVNSQQNNEPCVVLKMPRTKAQSASLNMEAEALEAVESPHLPSLIAYEADAWIAMEFVDGKPYFQWAESASISDIVDVACQLCDALTALHEQGLIHGDVKPSNILVDANNQATLLDLGLSCPIKTVRNQFRGTLGFVAPEVLQRQSIDERTDLYGLGATLYSGIARQPPFVAEDPAALSYLPLVSLPLPPQALVPDLPNALGNTIMKLLRRLPSNRPESAVLTKELLRRSLDSLPAPPVLGMLKERAELRRAVVGAADGEPRVVVLYGPPGSGRRTLISEAVDFAKSEGLTYIKGNELKKAVALVKSAKNPIVLVQRAQLRGARQFARWVLKEGGAALVLLHADRPQPTLQKDGAIQITPSPLTLSEAKRLVWMYGVTTSETENWWRETLGSPLSLLGRVHAWRSSAGLTEVAPLRLAPEAKKILAALHQVGGTMPVTDLATRLEMGEHQLLDHCEVLFASARIHPVDDGLAISLNAQED